MIYSFRQAVHGLRPHGIAAPVRSGSDDVVAAFGREGEYQHLRDKVGEICAAFPPAYFRDVDQHQGQPEEFATALREAGWANALVPPAEGGLGLSLAQACAVVEEVGIQGPPASGLVQEICNHRLLATHGRSGLTANYVRRIIGGGLCAASIASRGFPEHAVAVTECSPHAVKVNGRRVCVSRAQYSDVLLLLVESAASAALTETDRKSSLYVVDLRDAIGHGLTIGISRSLDHHDASDILIEDLWLPTSLRIGAEGEGARYIAERRHTELILSAAASVGDAIWFLHNAHDRLTRDAAREETGGKRLEITPCLSKAAVWVEAARLMYAKAAHLYDIGMAHEVEARKALAFALDATKAAAECCLNMGHHGEPALLEDVDRKLREGRRHQIEPFLMESVLSYIGEQVLGLPRSH